MRKVNVLFALCLLSCAGARRRRPGASRPGVEGTKRSPDYSDPADDIPGLDQLRNQYVKDEQPGHDLPRDVYDFENKKTGRKMTEQESKGRARMWLDFAAIHDRNLQKPLHQEPIKKHQKQSYAEDLPPPKVGKDFKSQFIAPRSFDLRRDHLTRYKPINWTTCEEFKRGAKFDPEDIVNKNWIPFYMWSKKFGKRALVHNFAHASKRAVEYYYNKLAPYLNKTIDWYQPKLIMTEGGKREELLIAGDRKGLHYVITNFDIPEYVKKNNSTVPLISIRMKIEDPYLVLMYCEENLAYVMAQENIGPQTDEDKRVEAELIGFRGKGRPVARNEKLEIQLAAIEQERKALKEARKYLPTDPDDGMFPPHLRDPPMPNSDIFHEPN